MPTDKGARCALRIYPANRPEFPNLDAGDVSCCDFAVIVRLDRNCTSLAWVRRIGKIYRRLPIHKVSEYINRCSTNEFDTSGAGD